MTVDSVKKFVKTTCVKSRYYLTYTLFGIDLKDLQVTIRCILKQFQIIFLRNFLNYMNERLFECIKLNVIHFA